MQTKTAIHEAVGAGHKTRFIQQSEAWMSTERCCQSALTLSTRENPKNTK